MSDYGFNHGQFGNMIVSDEIDAEEFNPLLLVKDFDSHGFSVDDSFMTNMDVPCILTEGIMDSPINPYTGRPIDCSEKMDGINIVSSKGEGADSSVYHVKDDIFKKENWSVVREVD